MKDYVNNDIAYILKTSKNTKLEKDITLDILEYLLLKRINTPQKQRPEKVSRLQMISVVLGVVVLCSVIIVPMFKALTGSAESDDTFAVIDDFSSYRFLNCYGKEEWIGCVISSILKVCDIIDNCDEQDMHKYLNPTCKNYLFYGPPGTGKTLFIKKLAFDLDIELRIRAWKKKKSTDDKTKIEQLTYDKLMKQEKKVKLLLVQPSSLLGKYVGETEKRIKELFARAVKESEKFVVLIFIDEIDAFFTQRGKANATEHGRNSQNEFLMSLDGARTPLSSKIFVFGATNMQKDIDPAFLRRMKNHKEFPLPNQEELFIIIKKFMEGNDWIVTDDIKELAREAQGMSQCDIATAVTDLFGKGSNYTNKFTFDDFKRVIKRRQGVKDQCGIVPVDFTMDENVKKSLNYHAIIPGAAWTTRE